MSRLRIPGLIDVLRTGDAGLIARLAEDPRLDRAYVARGPLINRIVAGRLRADLQVKGVPLPPVAPRGPERPLAAQAALEARLGPIAAALAGDDPALAPLAAYVRGHGAATAAGPLAQQAVGRLFDADYAADAESWSAALVLNAAPRTFNPFLLIWWALTGRVQRARRLLAAKVDGDLSGVHGTGLAVHNIVAGLVKMRALWADPESRRRLSPEAAAAGCLVAPEQVVRQPVRAGESLAGAFADTTLVLLQLEAASARDPGPDMAFMIRSWSRCPAHAWVPALLSATWRVAGEG